MTNQTHHIEVHMSPSRNKYNDWRRLPGDVLQMVGIDDRMIVIDVGRAKEILRDVQPPLFSTSRKFVDDIFEILEDAASTRLDENAVTNLPADVGVPVIFVALPPQVSGVVTDDDVTGAIVADGFKRMAKIHQSGAYMIDVAVIPESLSAHVVVGFGTKDEWVHRADAYDVLRKYGSQFKINPDQHPDDYLEQLFEKLWGFNVVNFVSKISRKDE